MHHRRHRNFRQLLLSRVLVSVALILIIATLTFLTLNVYGKLIQTNATKLPVITKTVGKSELKVGLPIRLKIPVINIDTNIYYVGLKSDGTMDIKPDPNLVAWYEPGPRPGELGNAVIAGHYGWIGDKGSVFNNIHKLVKGDEILVIDDKNITNTFVVHESKEYNPDADAENVFKSSDGKAHLNLITCEGVWVESQKTYTNRLVVFADKK